MTAEFEAMRENQRRNTDAALAAMPRLDVDRIAEVMRLRLEEGNLVARTPLPTTRTPGYQRAKVAEVEQPVMVRVVGGAPTGSADAVAPAEFLLQVVDYAKPRRITNLSISQNGTALFTLVHSTQTPTGSRNVQLMAQKGWAGAAGANVQFTVSEASFAPGEPPVNVTLTAPDCATLLRRDAAAVDKYLRPILAELGQEALFAPDPVLAMQVFPEVRRPDPNKAAEVERLLPQLADRDYRRRDRATAALRAMGIDAAVVLLHADRSRLTPEQNSRVDQVLFPLGLLPAADAARLRKDPEFLLNCLYSDDPAVRRAAVAALAAVMSGPVDIDPDAPAEVRSAKTREARARVAKSRG